MNYGDFKTLLAAYAHRSDLTTQLPNFIEHGRIRMCETLRVQEMLVSGAVTLTSGEGTLSSDVVQILNVQGSDGPLREVNLEEIGDWTGEGAYAVRGLTLLVPGASSVTVTYYERPVTMLGASDSVTRTVLSQYPHIWLQAALAELYRFTDDTDNEAKATDRMVSEIERANYRAAQVRHPRPAMRNRAIGYTAIAGGSGL